MCITIWWNMQKMSVLSMAIDNEKNYNHALRRYELPWPSGYELRLSLERSRVLILVKVIGGRQEGHPVQKMLTAPAKSQLTIGHRPSAVKTGSVWRKTTSSCITEVAEEICGRRKYEKNQPWITIKILEKMNERSKLKQHSHRRDEYKNTYKEIQRECRQDKENY